jgi:hypothetical protein
LCGGVFKHCFVSAVLQMAHQVQAIPYSDVHQSPAVSTQQQVNMDVKLQRNIYQHSAAESRRVSLTDMQHQWL